MRVGENKAAWVSSFKHHVIHLYTLSRSENMALKLLVANEQGKYDQLWLTVYMRQKQINCLRETRFFFSDTKMRKDLWVFIKSTPHKELSNIFTIIFTTNTVKSYITLILKFPSRMTNTILCGGLMTNSERDLTEFRGEKIDWMS